MWQTCRSSLIAQWLSSIPGSFFRVSSTNSAFRVFKSSKLSGLTDSSITQYTFSVIKGVLDNIGLFVSLDSVTIAICKRNCDVQEIGLFEPGEGPIGVMMGEIRDEESVEALMRLSSSRPAPFMVGTV